MSETSALFDAARSGDRTSLARLLSLIERGGSEARAVGRLSFALAGPASTVGITGAPGAGKSTLTSALVSRVRGTGSEVAVLAVDPSSPFTGGAILGDRVRMSDHSLDRGVFIRSMATRGHLGGLSLATPEAVRVLDASGYRWVVVETVGVGQVEVEVAGAADTTVVVVNPGWGDAVQANKAGLMEIADLFVVNKADRAGAAETRRDLESMLALGAHHDDPPAIVEAVATIGTGVAEVWAAVVAHRDRSIASGERDRRRAERVRTELREVVEARLREEAVRRCAGAAWDDAVAAVRAGDLDPWAAASRLLD